MSDRSTIASGKSWAFYQDCFVEDSFYLKLENSAFEVISTNNHKAVTVELTTEIIEQILKSYQTSSLIYRNPSKEKLSEE